MKWQPIETAPFDAAKYLTDDASQLEALKDAYDSGHSGVIDSMLAHVMRARNHQSQGSQPLPNPPEEENNG